MILEERDYRIKAGYVADFLEKYQTLGLPVQREHLGEPHGFSCPILANLTMSFRCGVTRT
ncbi:hypothetical protein GGD57_001317 [Rhizobium esperanzae]|uniref:Uncharacterized protein n=1 Tax=Rhizobium esperanzae TaxID=1967781 RepID=A0A7W6W3Y2_9HYPH|nr:hypothetical protein [Rhizobium esperanzae]